MLTFTEAGRAWERWKVAVNGVDPGYMSADPLVMAGECPLGWDDGVGRVLWVVARGEGGVLVWGRVLKHFTPVGGR